MKALRNFFNDCSIQFRRSGGLAARLSCVLRYWALYGRGRLKGLERGESHLGALAAMAAPHGSGPTTVRMLIDGGLTIEMDVFSAAYLAKEILDDGTYRARGFVPEAGWTVVDVGAQQGLFTLDSARRVGAAGRVVAVEPFPFNLALLERSVAANRLAQVSVVPLAAAESRGKKTLYVTPYSTGWQSLVFTGDGRVPMTIEADALDAILADHGVEKVDLLKIDVEGAWRLVFAGAPKLLSRKPLIVMEVEGSDTEVEEATARLDELGYAVERRDSVLFARPDGGAS